MQTRSLLWPALGLAIIVVAAGVFWLLNEDGSGPSASRPVASRATDDGTVTDIAPAALPTEDAGVEATPMDLGGLPDLTIVQGRVLDEQRQPIAQASLRVFEQTGMRPVVKRIPLTTTTEARDDGVFRIVELPEDRPLGIEILHDDFAPRFVEGFQAVRGEIVDLGDVVLKQGLTLAGTVTDLDRRRVAGATVTLSDLTALTTEDLPPLRLATTDGQGRYEIPHLAMRRQYRIEVSRDGYGSQSTVLSFVLTIPSETWNQDFVLETADSMLGGVVFDGENRGVAAAELTLSRRNPETNAYFEVRRTTGDDGTFWFEALPSGRYDLRLAAQGYYLTGSPRLESGRDDHEVHVLPALAIRGLLQADKIPDTFNVHIRPEARTGAGLVPGFEAERHYRSPDPPGTFLADGLKPGTYVLEVRAPGFAITRSQSMPMRATHPLVELPILMRRGGEIRGRLLEGGPGVSVELRGADYDPSLPIEGAFPTRPVFDMVQATDAEGRFRFHHVPTDTYTVSLKPPGKPPVHVRDVVVDELGVTDLGDIAMPKGGAIGGRVVGADGAPASGVRVIATGLDHFQQATTNDAGEFVIEGLPPGDYSLVASPTAFWDALRLRGEGSAYVRADERTEVLLDLGPLVPPRPDDPDR